MPPSTPPRAYPFVLLAIFLLLAPAPSAATTAAHLVDSDGDGIPDYLEDTNQDGIFQSDETDPHHVDSDRDGLPDGVEDSNRDGIVDVGETDPRLRDTDRDGVSDGMEVIVSGTDPLVHDIGSHEGRFSLLPEPLHFDLVRGLASRKGELEINSLFSGSPGEHLHWAPEIEYAVADGVAFELELPMVDDRLEAVKVAGQVRLPMFLTRALIHGMQGIVETRVADGETDLTVLWLVGAAPNKVFSVLGMVGTRWPIAHTPELLLNPTLFARLSERWVVGLETNGVVRTKGSPEVGLLPQVHWEPINHLRIQVGSGVRIDSGHVEPWLTGRLIVEL